VTLTLFIFSTTFYNELHLSSLPHSLSLYFGVESFVLYSAGYLNPCLLMLYDFYIQFSCSGLKKNQADYVTRTREVRKRLTYRERKCVGRVNTDSKILLMLKKEFINCGQDCSGSGQWSMTEFWVPVRQGIYWATVLLVKFFKKVRYLVFSENFRKGESDRSKASASNNKE
jgi:hypothetical protein